MKKEAMGFMDNKDEEEMELFKNRAKDAIQEWGIYLIFINNDLNLLLKCQQIFINYFPQYLVIHTKITMC